MPVTVVCRLVILALVLCAAVVEGQARKMDDSTTTPKTLTVAHQRPRTALIRSAAVPGWGQYRNGHPLKAVLFGGTAIGFLAAALVERDNLSRTNREIRDARTGLAMLAAAGADDTQLRASMVQLEGQFEDQAARRNTRLLYLFTTATLAAVDAYVDAHLADFGYPGPSLDVAPTAAGVFISLRLPLPAAARVN